MTEAADIPDAPADAIGLLDREADRVFDGAVRVLQRWLGTDVATVAFADPARDRLVFKAQLGLAEPWASAGEMAYSNSIFQHLEGAGSPQVIPDTKRNARLAGTGEPERMGIGAYLGAPLLAPSGRTIGTLCLLAAQPRAWDTHEIASLTDMADALSAHIALKMKAYWQGIRVLEAEQKAKADLEMLADIGHELRTPLNALLGSADALAVMPPNARPENLLSVLEQAGEQLRALADDLLSIGQMDAGVLPPNHEPFHPDQLARDTAALVGQARPSDAARLVTGPGGQDAGQVRGDLRRIRQVLANLLTNALDFAPKSIVRIGASLEPPGPDGSALLRFTVADSGPGVADSAKATVFERFRTGVRPPGRREGGAGLGLAVAMSICEWHGGALRVEDTPGGGATFTATFRVSVDKSA